MWHAHWCPFPNLYTRSLRKNFRLFKTLLLELVALIPVTTTLKQCDLQCSSSVCKPERWFLNPESRIESDVSRGDGHSLMYMWYKQKSIVVLLSFFLIKEVDWLCWVAPVRKSEIANE